MNAITACRTAALGGHVEACDDCGATRHAYNSCRDRHLPEVSGRRAGAMAGGPTGRVAAGPVFPRRVHAAPPIAAIAFQNKAVVYAILFRSAVEAMSTLAANPRRLGAKIGGLAILHTWGQDLTHHPHVHCVVPGGGLSLDGSRWIEGHATFFLAVKPLSGLFRRLFLERLRAAFDGHELGFFGDLARLADPRAFAAHLAATRRIDWIVYCKKPFGGPAQVLACLGRYTHRVAIANNRIRACDDDHVALAWKDYRDHGVVKSMRLSPGEFIRRFLLHVLPDGFHRIRHFGLLANGHRTETLTVCRAFLNNPGEPPTRASEEPSGAHPDEGARDLCACQQAFTQPCLECGAP